MAKGDKERCPKGGWPEYRNGEWYKQVLGQDQGDRMEENEGRYGYGAHKDTKYRYTTIEQKLSGVRKWYDQVRRVSARWTDEEGWGDTVPQIVWRWCRGAVQRAMEASGCAKAGRWRQRWPRPLGWAGRAPRTGSDGSTPSGGGAC
eukprot:2381899-Prymnesium_polylepis.1